MRFTAEQLDLLMNPLTDENIWDIVDKVSKFLHLIDTGRHRAGFMLPSRKAVIKVPMCREGFKANRQEAQLSSAYPQFVARTRMFGQSAVQVALKDTRMRDARMISFDYYPMNCWTPEEQELYEAQEEVVLVDGFNDQNLLQCGLNTKGRLVMYDCNEF